MFAGMRAFDCITILQKTYASFLCSLFVCARRCVRIEGPKSAQIYKSMQLMQTRRRQMEQVMDELWAGLGLISIHLQQTMNSSRPLQTRACYS
jgi:hypothetical protein